METNPIINPQPDPKKDQRVVQVEKAKDTSVKTLAVFGLIALLALVSIGIIKVAPSVIRGIASAAVSFSSVFIPAAKISVTTDKYTANTGQTFTLNWAQTGTDEGSYTISYPCIDNFHLEAIGQSSSTVIFCNTSFQFLNTNNSISLQGFITSNASQSVAVPITVHFTKNGATSQSAQGNITINIINTGTSPVITTGGQTSGTGTGVVSHPVNPGQPTTTIYPIPTSGGNTSNPYGPVDLTANILGTGVVSTTTNVFTAQSKVNPTDRAAIKFEIVNNGGTASGPFSFAVVLPTFPAYTFMSDLQPSLAPGDKIQYTIGFDEIQNQAENTFLINVDNTNRINESNKANNLVTGKIYVNTN